WVLANANGLGGIPQWTQLIPSGAGPAARENASAVYDPANNLMILFGGGANGNVFNDVWVLSHANGLGGTPVWTQLNIGGLNPVPRTAHAAVYDAATNIMTVFGGEGASGQEFDETWQLSNANGMNGAPVWTQLGPFQTAPAARLGRTALDPGTGNMVLFGGDTNGTEWNDTWVLGSVPAPAVNITITPASGTNDGPVSAVLAGSSLLNGAQVKLVAAGQPDIPATTLSNPTPSTLQVTFDLAG